MIVDSLRLIVEHEVMPHPRLAHNKKALRISRERITNKGILRTIDYLANRDALAWLFKAKAGTKRLPDKMRLRADISIWKKELHIADLDNLIKTVFDALQTAGVIVNDKWIRQANVRIYDGVPKPSIAIRIELIDSP